MNAVTRNQIHQLAKKLGGYIHTDVTTNVFLPSTRAADIFIISLYSIAPGAPFDRCGTQITIYS